MTEAEKYISSLLFDNRVFEYNGQQFEDFFGKIMRSYDPDYQQVKPHGNIGDRKNDGFNKVSGTYYQIYSPEDITKYKTISNAIKKLEEDFILLYDHWNNICPITEYFFVINDKFKGVPEPIITKQIELQNNPKYKHIRIEIFNSDNLKEIFSKLGKDKIQNIIGYVPNEDLELLEYDALNKTISHLLNTPITSIDNENLSIPNFGEKIKFNHLGNVIEDLLIAASYQEGELKEFFDTNPGLNNKVKERFQSLYNKAKIEFEHDIESGDRQFTYILENASPENTYAYRNCVLILMAHYFSTCDIFEEPLLKGNT